MTKIIFFLIFVHYFNTLQMDDLNQISENQKYIAERVNCERSETRGKTSEKFGIYKFAFCVSERA